jgi:hypothetical protein
LTSHEEEDLMTDKDRKPQVGEVERSFEPGEQPGYQTDTFSRNDREGVPAEDVCGPEEKPAQTSSVETKPEPKRRKAGDDADSRDAGPMAPREGGVR